MQVLLFAGNKILIYYQIKVWPSGFMPMTRPILFVRQFFMFSLIIKELTSTRYLNDGAAIDKDITNFFAKKEKIVYTFIRRDYFKGEGRGRLYPERIYIYIDILSGNNISRSPYS